MYLANLSFSSISAPPPPFPTYLVPSQPFRRRLSSVDSTESYSPSVSSSDSNAGSSPPIPQTYLAGHSSRLRCARCLSDLALADQIISKGFTGRYGRAYLVAPSGSAISPNPLHIPSVRARNDALPNLPNTHVHRPVPRQLVTGAHTVGDISCAHCGSVLGWKYIAADEEAQRYKVGKFILETKRVCRSSTWEDAGDGEGLHDGSGGNASSHQLGGGGRRSSYAVPPNEIPTVAEEEIEFDSQDEDECEDLFMGIWTPQLAAKRRKAKYFAGSEV